MSEQLYVLGHPVAHSKSPVMHNALYYALGLDWRYDLKDCATQAEAQAFLTEGKFLGINITMPYKPDAYQAAQVRHPSAVLAQGANVLVHDGEGQLVCHNMDGEGCITYLEDLGVDFAGAQVAVCGTGPTSLAIMHAAGVHGAAGVTLVGRSRPKTELVVEAYLERLALSEDADLAVSCAFAGEDYAAAGSPIDPEWTDLEDAPTLTRADVVIDATPLGMHPDDGAAFDGSLLREGQFVFDVVYGHGETQLARNAAAAGCRFANGEGMLVSQAVLGAWAFMDAAGVEQDVSYREAFGIMKMAAGF